MNKENFKKMYSELRKLRRDCARSDDNVYSARNTPDYLQVVRAHEIVWAWRWEARAPSRLIRHIRDHKFCPSPKFRGQTDPGVYYKEAFKKRHHFYPNQYAILQQAREKIQSLGW